MPLSIRKALIVYCSPAGSTEHVARVMETKLRAREMPVILLDLGREPDIPFVLSQLPAARDNICLFIGSPVYTSQPVPPVMAFLRGLPVARRGYAVPFVTWGGVTSGIALYLMGKELEERGYALLGAAKVLARHSVMWNCADPVGKGHPDGEDDRMIEELTDIVGAKLDLSDPPTTPLADLDYQPRETRDLMSTLGIEAVKDQMPEKKLDMERCTGCAICAESCPVDAIQLVPYPEIGPSCIHCWNCVRLCPEEALTVDLTPNYARIKAMKARFQEPDGTRIFT
ncbi:MAG: 4Fe-4S binding protein [Deltaproteobacteria bacterium]|nr:4Fe-4S binding protein [Deltaproteobacteria bacterium]